jgi:hypothetical protein
MVAACRRKQKGRVSGRAVGLAHWRFGGRYEPVRFIFRPSSHARAIRVSILHITRWPFCGLYLAGRAIDRMSKSGGQFSMGMRILKFATTPIHLRFTC